jgi:hypothetical protein
MAITTSLTITGLGKHAMSALTDKAKRLGVTPERYVRDLLQEDLDLDRKARTTTLAELMGPGRDIDESELDRLVEAARTRHYRRSAGKK